jgi:hypothetical protein
MYSAYCDLRIQSNHSLSVTKLFPLNWYVLLPKSQITWLLVNNICSLPSSVMYESKMFRYILLSLLAYIFIFLENENSRVVCLKGCTYQNVNYTECDLMFWTSWTVCDGSSCPRGEQQRKKGVCCPNPGNVTNDIIFKMCKRDCNMTDDDFQETASYVPPPSTAPSSSFVPSSVVIQSTSAQSTTPPKGTQLSCWIRS